MLCLLLMLLLVSTLRVGPHCCDCDSHKFQHDSHCLAHCQMNRGWLSSHPSFLLACLKQISRLHQ